MNSSTFVVSRVYENQECVTACALEIQRTPSLIVPYSKVGKCYRYSVFTSVSCSWVKLMK